MMSGAPFVRLSDRQMAEHPRTPFDGEYPPDHADLCETPYCCTRHSFSGQDWSHDDECKRRGPRFTPWFEELV